MRLQKARIRSYRSIRDSGWFDIESMKTIMVGPNEAGKTVLLRALEQINPPDDVQGFDPLRDFPRSELTDLDLDGSGPGTISPDDVTVVEAHFVLDENDLEPIIEIDEGFAGSSYVVGRRLSNEFQHRIEGGPEIPTYGDIRKDLSRLATHVDKQDSAESEGSSASTHRHSLDVIVSEWRDSTKITRAKAESLRQWIDDVTTFVDEENSTEENRLDRLARAVSVIERIDEALDLLRERLPVFVYFSSYFRVRPRLHLDHLASRMEQGDLDDQYDRGNICLLKFLGFDARILSDLGYATEPGAGDEQALKNYEDQLDKRNYQLNAASIKLTDSINEVWNPDPQKAEADRLRIQADNQYLKVVVEDDLGVDVELDQRSEGYRWLVSFFVVFFAEAAGRHQNAILLLDEPGLSLHGLKQREFRSTVSRLAETNQLVYTTHSPFMVGPDELDIVRVVEMTDRRIGTLVHTTVAAGDSVALLPLQEALGYDLAQSLFSRKRNLVLEGLTDYWYLDATAALLRESGEANLNEKISPNPASGAGKIVYFATILHANSLKVAALLDSDAAGDAAAEVETLIHTLGNKNILRTKDAYTGNVSRPEIEDLLRDTLIDVANADLGWDITDAASRQPGRPVVDIFTDEIGKRVFSKYRLAKAYLRWTREHEAEHLTGEERAQWKKLIDNINRALR